MKNKNKSKKIQKFLAQQSGASGMNKNQEMDAMYKEKKEKLKREQKGAHTRNLWPSLANIQIFLLRDCGVSAAREMALLFKQAPKSKAELAREKTANKL